ncbi:MAG TPA: lytic transglycosylase domain-containing protein [Terriglobia bacterium]
MLFVFLLPIPVSAADNTIISIVNADGRRVFTNVIENTATPAAAPVILAAVETGGVLAAEIPEPLRALVDTISKNYGVDPALVRAVIKTESNFNRWAVSNKGALGLMQLIPETGRRYGVRDFFDPAQNVDGGVHYLSFLLDKFNGNLDLSLAAYNAGENLVGRLGRIPPIPETTNYVRKIRAIYQEKPAPAPAKAAAIAPAPQEPEPARIYKVVDERGVAHFSNFAPPGN